MNFELLKTKTNNFLGKIKHKLSAKIWNSYLLTYDQYLKLIKEKIIKIHKIHAIKPFVVK